MEQCTTNTYEMKREIISFSNKLSEGLSRPERKFYTDITYGMLTSRGGNGMKNRAFALVSAVALCLGLALPATAAGTGVTVAGLVYYPDSDYAMRQPFSNGRAVIAIREPGQTLAKYGYIDTSGKLVIPVVYARAEEFREGLAAVRKDGGAGQIGEAGAIDRNGNVVIPFKYDSPSPFSRKRITRV